MKRHLRPYWHGGLLLFLVSALLPASALADAESLPLGTYSTTIAGDLWEMVLNTDGQYDIVFNGELVVEGRFTATPKTLILHDESGPFACTWDNPSGTTAPPGVYMWEFEGNQLTLTVSADTCDGREGILTAGPWDLR